MNDINREEYIQNILKELETDDKNKQVWVLKNNKGQILKLRSGKSSWRKRNHATSALVHHIFLDWNERDKLGFKNEIEVKDYLISQGLIIVERLF